MKNRVQREILKLLIDRAPNYVSETIIFFRLSHREQKDVEYALRNLVEVGQIISEKDEHKVSDIIINYYRVKELANLPIRETIKIGEKEVPRVLSDSILRFFPENLNEQIERLSEYADTLEKRFVKLVKKEQRKYWGNVIGIFGAFISILSIIIVGLPKITTDTSLSFKQILILNLSQLLPIAIVLAILVVVLRLIIW